MTRRKVGRRIARVELSLAGFIAPQGAWLTRIVDYRTIIHYRMTDCVIATLLEARPRGSSLIRVRFGMSRLIM
jgi:hypothetical protein